MLGNILVILSVYFSVLPIDVTTSQNQSTCRNVSYNVQTLHQVCCEKSSQSMEVAELKSQMAELKLRLQMVELRTTNDYDIPRDCEEIKARNLESGMYKIDPDGADGVPPLRVRCNMTTTPAQIIVEHNYTTKTEVVNAQHPNGNTYNIEYFGITKSQMVKLIQRKLCWQFLRYDCHGSLLSSGRRMVAYWVDRNNNKVNYWPGGHYFGCACGITKTCTGGPSQSCECDRNDGVWRFDEGNITDDLRLPVKSLHFVDTDAASEKGHFTLGPLICH